MPWPSRRTCGLSAGERSDFAREPVNYIETTFQGLIVCRNYKRTWSFPSEVAELLKRETAGQSVLHLYAGMADFGMRLDADPLTMPDVIGSALFPPFNCESFDAVIVDPPYKSIFNMPSVCLMPAACIARKNVWWFHTHFQTYTNGLHPRRWWSVLPSRRGPLRILMEFERIRHPNHCFNTNWRWSAEMQTYNWSRHVGQRSLVM